MNERRWLTCKSVDKLFAVLGHRRLSTRKARLFACACCRRIWHLLDDERSRAAVTLSELHPSSPITSPILRQASAAAGQAVQDFIHRHGNIEWDYYDDETDYYARGGEPAQVTFADPAHQWQVQALRAANYAICGYATYAAPNAAQAEAQSSGGVVPQPIAAAQAALVRDIYGNPFRRYPRRLRTTAAVRDLATALNAGTDCSFALHDALLEMDQPKLAAHFRTGVHVPGCWVAERILGTG